MAQKQKQKVPSAAKIKTAESGIDKIREGLVKLVTILTGNQQKLIALRSRLAATAAPALMQKYAALAKAQLALESAAKAQAERYKVLAGAMNRLKGLFIAIAKGATATAGAIWDTARKSVSWLVSKLSKKSAGTGNIESIDDLGVAPLVIWAVVVATIAALSAAIGYLINRASALEEQIDALNDDIDSYEQQLSQRPQGTAEGGAAADYSYQDDSDYDNQDDSGDSDSNDSDFNF